LMPGEVMHDGDGGEHYSGPATSDNDRKLPAC
jgi:hypothetical protein